MKEKTSLSNLIKALNILCEYEDPLFPTHCEHGELWININPDNVSQEDKDRLKVLSFEPEDNLFRSFSYGSS